MSSPDRRCICAHHETTHIIDGKESVCMHDGCKCKSYHLWEAAFYDPIGKMHKVSDIRKFVLENKEGLFSDDELRMINRHGKPHITYAELGLSSLIQNVAESWHGWTIMTFPKTYYP